MLKMRHFVLSPMSSDDQFALASREAMLAFARAIKLTDAGLAEDLCKWVEHLDLTDNREGK